MPTTRHQSLTLAAVLTTMVAPVATQSEPEVRIGAKATVPADDLLLAKLARQPEAGLADLPDHRTIGDPFAIAQLLRSPQPHVRARAAILLRQKLSLPLPESTLAAANAAVILQHEVRPARPSSRLLTMVLAQQAIDQLATHASISPVLSTDPRQLTSSQRQLIAAQLLQHGSDTSLERASTTVIACLQTAMRINPAACLHIVGLAIDTPCKATRTGALLALQRECRRRVRLRLEPLPDACAALALTLLDSTSAEASQTAALLLEHVLHQGSDPVVLAAIHRRANDRICRDIEALQLAHPQHYGCTGGTSLPQHADHHGTQLVVTSARLGNRELIQPILDQLREFPGRCDAHTSFLMCCLYWLAPLTKPEQAARMFQPLAPHVRSRPIELGRRTLFRLYATVPPDLLPLLDKWHTGEASNAFWFGVASVAEHLCPERIERLLCLKPGFLASVVVHEPERIREAWLAGNRDEATAMLTSAWFAAPRRMLPFAKTLPIRLVANSSVACRHGRYPLGLLLHLQAGLRSGSWLMDGPISADDLDRTRMREGLVRNLPSALMQPEELPQLAPFATDADHRLAIAAATRAYWLSDNGRDWCRDVLTKIGARESVAAKVAALREGVRLGVRPDNWRTTVTDLLESDRAQQARIVTTAALVRFGEQPIEIPKDIRKQVLTLVQEQADGKTLRQLVHSIADFASLQYQTSASTTIAIMQLAMEFPEWPQYLERRVLQATSDPFASVRRAAYTALATRDRRDSAGGWLAFEASLDPNESVRSVAPTK